MILTESTSFSVENVDREQSTTPDVYSSESGPRGVARILRGGFPSPSRGVWGHAPPEKFWEFGSLRLRLVSSGWYRKYTLATSSRSISCDLAERVKQVARARASYPAGIGKGSSSYTYNGCLKLSGVAI